MTVSTVIGCSTACRTAARYSLVMRCPWSFRAVAGCVRGAVQWRGAACHWRVVTHREGALDGLDLVAAAPARDKGAGQYRIAKIDRGRVIQHAAQSRRRHRPAL